MEAHCLRSWEQIGSNSLLCSHPKIPDDDDDDDGDDDDDDDDDDEKEDDHHPCLGLPHLIGTLPPADLWHRPCSHHLVLTIKTTRPMETIRPNRTIKIMKKKKLKMENFTNM